MPGFHHDVSRRIERLAADFHGVLTWSDLRRIGVSRNAIARRVASGELIRTKLGVYIVAALRDSWTDVVAQLKGDQRLAATNELASAIYTWDGFDRPRSDLLVNPTFGTPWTSDPGLRAYRRRDLASTDIICHRGVRVTSPAWTLRHLEEAGVCRDDLELAVECALRRQDVTEDQLANATGLLREVMTLRGSGTPPTESPLETKAVQAFRLYGLPAPLRQVRVFIGRDAVGRVDFLMPNWTVVEVDGKQHADPTKKRADDIRDMDMAGVGLTVNRVGWVEIERFGGDMCARLARVIAEGRRDPLPFRGQDLHF